MNVSTGSLVKLAPLKSIDINRGNREVFMTILASQQAKKGCLPAKLGLNDSDFHNLLRRLYKRNAIHDQAMLWNSETNNLRQELLELRHKEWVDIVKLLSSFRNGEDESELLLAQIIAAGCLGANHLWRDLGLATRQSLRIIFEENFSSFARKNTDNMRWKKFIYRQLCEQSGHYVCRSPSCETCPTFNECFGEEL